MPDVIADLDRDERGREAEITPEMIEAGIKVSRKCDALPEVSEGRVIAEIYEAMTLAKWKDGHGCV